MSLAHIQIPREEVMFRGEPLSFRGLSLNDFSTLMRGHLADLNKLFDLYDNEETRETAIAQSAKFAITIVQETPAMVAQLIVLASDSPQEEIEIAQQFPLPLQVECVRAIINLTFEEAGGAKKFLDSLMAMVTSLRPKAASEG